MSNEPQERRVGPYLLRERLGAGGMGVVHRAVHVETGAVHALKLVATASADDVLRFHREAQAMALVDGHPNVLRVHAAGSDAGRVWIAMELAEGGGLDERLERGPLAPLEAGALVRAVALGLAHVHGRGVIHRDLKPANILFDKEGTPKLADWGLARVRGAASLTNTGTLLGTPSYMAPEQVRGDKTIDERTDVYGAGAVLFHALTGRPPFVSPTPTALLEQVLSAAPPRPRSLAPGTPSWLEEECLRALAKAPGSRHPDARALALALSGPTRRAGSPRALMLGAAGALLLATAAGVVSFYRSEAAVVAPPPPPPRVSDVVTFDAVTFDALLARDLDEASRVAEDAIATGGVPALLCAAEAALERGEAQRALEHGRAALEATSADGGVAHARARWALGRAFLLADDLASAESHLESSAVQRLEGDAPLALAELERARVALCQPMSLLHMFADVTQEKAKAFVVALKLLAASRPDKVYPPLGRLGRLLGRRLQATVVERGAELKALRINGSFTMEENLAALVAAREAAPGTPESAGLQVVALWTEADALIVLQDGTSRARVAALYRELEVALRGPLSDRHRRIAIAASWMTGAATLPDATPLLERSVAVVEDAAAPTDSFYGVFATHRERIIQHLYVTAWTDGAKRAALAARGLALCEVPGDHEASPCSPRLRSLLRLVTHQPVRDEDLLMADDEARVLFQAEHALAKGDLEGARSLYRKLEELERPSEHKTYLIDALSGQALVVAALGDVAEAERLLADARSFPSLQSRLPWRSVVLVEQSIALVISGDWRPGRDQVYPLAVAPR